MEQRVGLKCSSNSVCSVSEVRCNGSFACNVPVRTVCRLKVRIAWHTVLCVCSPYK
jgi:hypothetical protein